MLKGLLVWERWLSADIYLRDCYTSQALTRSKQLLNCEDGKVATISQAAESAYAFRNRLLTSSRRRTSPIGFFATQIIKPEPRTYEFYVAKYTKDLMGYEARFESLEYHQAVQVTKNSDSDFIFVDTELTDSQFSDW
jgi:hypothetical protein